ncbi:hypothetical protein WJX81_007059 [Elliptochloris bilobata]|uniref:Peptidase M24 domain-containing protein n=1 Tax=Elliptochloris bilobata TaxID=381761 RepID=A0AAW1R9W5_9CHLO
MVDSENEREEEELDLSNSDVVTKYKAAADITNSVLAELLRKCTAGAKIVDVCSAGDEAIEQATLKVFKGKKIEKGVAFPTCVSVNSVVGNFSPMADDGTELKDGDMVKIDLGCHIDGFIATAAHTVLVQADAVAPVEGRPAEILAAAHTALEAALRLVRPGKSIAEVAPVLQRVVEAHGCSLVEGVLSHQLKQFVIDGNKCILSKVTPEMRVDDQEFEENEVYAVNIVVSGGEGKTRVLDEKATTLYKRALDVSYHLKIKASRTVFNEITQRFPTMPFTLRALPGRETRLGLHECLNHSLLHPYPVLHEKAGEQVAQFKATVLLMPNGSDRITAAPLQELRNTKAVEDPELRKLLVASLKSKKKSKPRKGKDKKKAEDGDGPVDMEIGGSTVADVAASGGAGDHSVVRP